METNGIRRAWTLLGGTNAVAKIAGVRPPTASQWLHGIRRVPLERCLLIEAATDGQVARKDLRPDINWDLLSGRPAKAPA